MNSQEKTSVIEDRIERLERCVSMLAYMCEKLDVDGPSRRSTGTDLHYYGPWDKIREELKALEEKE
jgi:hypothetical protein